MNFLFLGCGLVMVAGVGQLLLRRRGRLADRLYAVLVVSGCALGLVPAVGVLTGGPSLLSTLPASLPGGPWVFGIDPLSAWFMLIVLVGGGCAGVFGIGYLAGERAHRSVAGAHALFALLLTALVGVVTAQAMVPFLAAWEVMAVCAYLLVMFEHERPTVRRSGFIYLVLTHVSTLALLAMFAALSAHGEGRTFSAFAASHQPRGDTLTFVLLFALTGFGLKAGMVPLHFWLPGAHAAAPSHASAVLSGVMLKMGIYGLLRVLTLVGAPPAWFGWALFGLGLGSGVLGVLWALGERDLKRMLAYSSVENVGIILLSMGAGVLGQAKGEPVLAVLGYTGALLHALNHALFKSLLFLGAGSVVRATGTRVLDELGGLGRQLPWTAAAFGIGAVAIIGVPPLNGFLGEWIAVQGLLAGAQRPGTTALLVLGVAGLALIGGLALACFSRAVGGVFLGQPRRARAAVREDWALVGPLLVLAGLCIGIGAVPAVVLAPVSRAVALLVGGTAPATGSGLGSVDLTAPGLLLGLLTGAAVSIWGLRRWAAGRRAARQTATWGCAYPLPAARMQYTAGSFADPLLNAFGPVARPRVERSETLLTTRAGDRILEGLVRPLWDRVKGVAVAFRPLQQGPITRYLQYIVAVVVLLLVALFTSIRSP